MPSLECYRAATAQSLRQKLRQRVPDRELDALNSDMLASGTQLHHLLTPLQVLGVTAGNADLVLFIMGEMTLDQAMLSVILIEDHVRGVPPVVRL